MWEFAGGIAYGVAGAAAFLYVILLGLGIYLETHADLPEESEIDLIIWFVLSLGPLRFAGYVLVALLWPLLLATVIVFWLVFKERESREGLSANTTRSIEWFFLGFGKFVRIE